MVRDVDSRGNCSKCGGTHYGSYMCPMTDSVSPQETTMIKPTIGRVVWFHPASNGAESGFAPAAICAAIVAYVHSDTCVNLAVFDANGAAHSKTSVTLIQEGETPPEYGYYCEWMPYQKGQAAKTEALEAKAAA